MDVRKLMVCGLVAGFGLALVSKAAWADGPKGTAVIKGKVVLADGAKVKTKRIKMGGTPACAGMHSKAVPDQGTLVYKKQGNAVPYTFVYLKKGVAAKYDPPETPIVLNQQGCMYHPHVFGMIAGQGIDIKNSDNLNHNIHSLAKKNPTFNFLQANPMTKQLRGKATFTKKEVMVKIKCDVHSWMSSYCGVLTHPFFDVSKSHEDTKVKDERGTFMIKDLPAGTYVVEAIHEKLGKVTQKVTVKDGETKEIEIAIGGKGAAPMAFRTVELPVTDAAVRSDEAEGAADSVEKE